MATVPQIQNGHNGYALSADFIPTTSLPEAPCSLNLFVEIAGLGKVQVTGRGCTAQQAVSNLLGQVELLKYQAPPLEPPPALSKEEHLTRLLTQWRRAAIARGSWSLIERLGKAEVLFLSGAVAPGNRDGLLTVRSSQNPDLWYDVENQMCTCHDWEKATKAGQSRPCKHILAAELWKRIEVVV